MSNPTDALEQAKRVMACLHQFTLSQPSVCLHCGVDKAAGDQMESDADRLIAAAHASAQQEIERLTAEVEQLRASLAAQTVDTK